MRPTRTFEQGDVVRVPFPYTDRSTRQHRPAVVVSRAGVEVGESLLWVLMITSTANHAWPGDVSIPDHAAAGLPAPSIVRTAKIATIAAMHADRIGRLPDVVRDEVRERLRRTLS